MNPGRSEAQSTSDEIERILQLCGLESPPHLVESVVLYCALLQKWNLRINLTSLKNPTEIITTHFAESFFAAGYLQPTDTPVLDIGSGAGFPALAMKLWRPEISFYLLEPRKKRAAFLSAVRRELRLSEVFVLSKTVEECCEMDFSQQPGLLTLRAVGEGAALIKRSLQLARPEARTMLFLTAGKVGEVLSQLPELAWNEPIPIPWSRQRVIVLGEANLKCST
jgi:16S rRNA (guanine(527)-N(7))-methyltransferase RsmG